MAQTVALVIAHKGYQHVEYGVTKETLENEGFTVLTASDKAGMAEAKDGTHTMVDATVDQLDIHTIDALFFIGGPGAEEYLDNKKSYALLHAIQKTGKPFGSICIASRILARAGVLAGKRATGWDGDHELSGIFEDHDVTYIQEPCVVDGTIITAVGPADAHEFAENIITVMEQ